ncbi:DUF1648 domain-containing protein [Bradyrhizobium sp. 186]|uniref:DUF1648 domain-containing protein n=1 Tax=Bradyrhizobium sp. 186 TaxID=2782654 RepID=UPI0020006E3D|nr:DUF1648 domain-containing protein [Bradyrhizobium sp. 186]UPK33494.1 DUF1648 domain-containing protein [Bradyrhizobium sp. 186]
MLSADLIFWPIVGLLAACNLYFGPRISSDQIAMQWGLDGRPTWYASKAVGLWGMVAFALAVRSLIWVLSTYAPSKVHGAEIGLVLFSVIVGTSHVLIIRKAVQAS